jgi:hypothetical protein
MRFTFLNPNKKSPEFKKEYELYKIMLIAIAEILAISFVFLFFFKFLEEKLTPNNLIILVSTCVLFLILNFQFAINSTKNSQIAIAANLMLNQLIGLEMIQQKLIFFPFKLFLIEIDKGDLAIFFFLLDIGVLLLLYYLNTIYPSHRYEQS